MEAKDIVPYAQIASSLSIVIATIAFYAAWKLQHTIKAQDFWSTYMQKAMDCPALAYPPGHADLFDYGRRKIKIAKASEISNETHLTLQRQEYERYEWFLSYLLKTSRQILRWLNRDKYWRETIKRNIRYHAAYFSARKEEKDRENEEAKGSGGKAKTDFVDWSGKAVKELIAEVIAEYREEEMKKRLSTQ